MLTKEKTMSEHTPGPWTLDGPAQYSDPTFGAMVYATHGNGHLVATIQYDYARDLQPANARLIAASPDLLAVAKRAVQLAGRAIDWNLPEVEIDGETVDTFDLREEFRAAIAKATT
jgi:hypothetical protein